MARKEGRYQSLIERLLGIRHIFENRQRIRRVSFEYLNRELLWHGFAEFIFFVLPWINFQRLKNILRRTFGSSIQNIEQSSFVKRDMWDKCPECDETPCNPHIAECGHVFCYYCIKANCMADATYKCPSCGSPVQESSISCATRQ